MTFTFTRIFIAGAAAAALLATVPASAQEYTLRLHSFGSPTSLDHTAHLDRWAETVEEQSGGRIEVEVYPAMQLGGRASDLVQQLEDGVVDIIWTLPGFTPGRFPGAQGLELPFMNTGKSATMSPAAMEFILGHLGKEFEGIKVIAVHATDGALIHTIDEPIEDLSDFEGKRLRVAGRFIGEAVKGLGATPVGIAFPEVYEALSRNQVDGMLINWAITDPMRFYEVTSYHTDEPLYQSMLMTLMSQASYDKLPEDLQKVIDDNSGIEYATRMGEIWDTATEPARQKAVGNGNTLVTLSAEERAKWKEAVEPAYQAWIETMNEQGYDGEALFATLQEITAKYGRE
ncbi:MAG: TRAP transporter substrate-binding protein [Pseudomonadota bacterium]